MSLTAAQVRSGRAMLNWSLLELARAAGLSVSVVKRIEDGTAGAHAGQAIGMIREALEGRGVEFIPDDGRGAGLRLRDHGRA